jgi:O-methyltransferase involved in polyketide biosynthesis
MSQQQPHPSLPGVPLAATAEWIAAVRASETRRPDRLLDDPWAAALAGPHGEDWLGERAESPALTDITIRARFFDDFLQRVTGTGEVRQVVLLAAGLVPHQAAFARLTMRRRRGSAV